MTAPPEATSAAIPLRDAALCVDCDCIIDTRVLRGQKARTCRDHTWVRLARWIPMVEDASEPATPVDESDDDIPY